MQTALRCDTLCPRSSPTFQRETSPNIKYWKAINKRREVCLFDKLPRNRRLSRELARALFDTHELWVKGLDWNVSQPGDDPLVTSMISLPEYSNAPEPRLVFAHISLEGICSYRRYIVEAWDYKGLDPSFVSFPRHQIQRKTSNKTGTISQRTNASVFKAGMQSGHGLQVNDIVDVVWNGGSRHTVKVTGVLSNTVTFGEGSGFDTPNQNTSIVVIRQPGVGDLFTYQWSHLNNPDEWGVGRVLGRMKHLVTVRNWLPFASKRAVRKEKENQGKDQFPGEWIRSEAGTYLLTASYRYPSIRLDRFANMQTGAGINAIMRKEPMTTDVDNPNPPERGRMMDFIYGLNIVRSLYIAGIKWPGIQYGYQNPDADFETDEWWLPSPGNAETNFPYIGVGAVENYVNRSTTSPIPLNWMRTALEVFSEGFQGNYGPNYTETHFNRLALGPLATRTNNTSGTVSIPKHPFLQGGTAAALEWDSEGHTGKRENVVITIVNASTVSFTGGTGDDLPPVGTWVQFTGFTTAMVGFQYFPEAYGAGLAISDRSVYHSIDMGAQLFDFAYFGAGLIDRTTNYFCYPGLDMPTSTSEGIPNGSPVGLPGLYNGTHGVSGYQHFFMNSFGFTPIWVNDTPRREEVLENFTPQYQGHFLWLTENTVWSAYHPFGWLPSNNFERLSSNIGTFVHSAGFETGWQNILSQYEILSSQPFSDEESAYDWLKRDASVGSSGFGITNVEFTHDVFAKYGATIKVWRSRYGNTTSYKYGAELLAHSTKTYNYWESMMWLGGLTIEGPSILVNRTIVTYDDIMETADTEVTPIPDTFTIQTWDDGLFTQDVPYLDFEGVPFNYIGAGLSEIQTGRTFKVDAAYSEKYSFFVTHDFSLDA